MVETMTAAPAGDDGERAGEVVTVGESQRKRVRRAGTGEESEFLGLRVTLSEMKEIEAAMRFVPDCTKSTVVRAILRLGLKAVKASPAKLGEGMIVKPGR